MSHELPSSSDATRRDFLQSAGALADAPLRPAVAASAAANPTAAAAADADVVEVVRSASVVAAGGTG